MLGWFMALRATPTAMNDKHRYKMHIAYYSIDYHYHHHHHHHHHHQNHKVLKKLTILKQHQMRNLPLNSRTAKPLATILWSVK